MKTGEAEHWLWEQLKDIYNESEAAKIASMILEHITGLPRAERLMKKDEPLVVGQSHLLTEYYHRLINHEPVQYVLNEAWFYGLKLFMDNHVLIPRPETEELVDWIVKDVRKAGKDVFERRPAEADKTSSLKIIDVGTGSGCIALALKKAMPKAEVWGCDASESALNVARRNGSELNIRVDFTGVNFLDEAQRRQLPTVDIIVSNPPYIPLKDKKTMDVNVVAHEPHSALFVPDDDPLIFYKALADFGKHRLHAGGFIYMEINEELGLYTTRLFKTEGYINVELKQDMQGKDRMIKVQKAHSPLHTPVSKGITSANKI
ncbi:peptide chain release factor N(5)-glutamine methyltransferase [Chitinophagaceae bacterium LB-8]|uniref:peptide chain release factor N(5)-glutamine methyltransferase n=1 Tax=Paraflavisolibacter caeni TaxID=2982496 RepID=A0A9X2XWL1_9BACT|nr:peptide chain release factor N(5)-glutamine methyltransferase [Paraflavisolibacter caeni]MCU7550586.1 peptide chain release factor N(5)-glutamine methyltransferase [Paraflavisolibacter caeni]